MNLSKVAIWLSLPLTVVGLTASVFIAVAGAGHGDKSSIMLIFPIPMLVWPLGGWVLGLVAAFLQFPSYALSIYIASRRHLEWVAAAAVVILHFGVAVGFWILLRLS